MVISALTRARFNAAFFLAVLCGLICIGLLASQCTVSDNSEASSSEQSSVPIREAQGVYIYVARIDGNVKYRLDTWPDENSGVTGDIEDALFAAGENGTVIISGGSSGETYTDAELDSTDYQIDTQANNQTLRGAELSDDPSGKHTGPVTLVSTDNNVIYNSGKIGFFLKNLNISGGSVPPPKYGIMDEGQTNTENVVLDGLGSALAVNGSHPVTHERLVVKNCQKTADASIFFDSSGTGNFHYCSIEGNNSSYALIAKDGTLNIYNCLFIGNKRYALYTTGYNDPYITVKNSIFAGNVTDLSEVHVINNSAPNGTIDISNSVLLPHPTKSGTYFLENVTLPSPDNNIYSLPQFKAGRRPAIVVLGVDDAMNFEYFKNLADESAKRGFKAVFFANTGSFSRWNELQAYVGEGHEVASHTRWHSDMTNYDGIQIQYNGSGTVCSLAINSNRLTTRVTGGPGGEDLSIDLSGSKLSTLADYINNQPGYSCSWENDLGSNTRSKCLADVFSQDIKSSPYTCKLDPTRYYDEELSNSKSDIEENLYDHFCKSFAAPGNRTNEALQEALKLRGYLGARSTVSGSYLLENCEIYNIRGRGVGAIVGWHNVNRNTAAFCEFLNYVGGIYVLYNHNEADYKLEKWKTVLDVIVKSNVTVMTLTEAIEHIRNIRTGFLPPGTDADDDQERWTRTFVDSSDYSLNPSSPLIDAGVDVGLTHDFAGTPVPQGQKPDIGLFEYTPIIYTPVPPCRIVDTRLAGGAIPPGDIRNYNVWGEVASQGGNPSGCDSPLGEPKAVYLKVTAVPVYDNGNIQAFPYALIAESDSLLSVSYQSDGQNYTNSGILSTCFHCGKDISIQSDLGTAHVVADVLGYYCLKINYAAEAEKNKFVGAEIIDKGFYPPPVLVGWLGNAAEEDSYLEYKMWLQTGGTYTMKIGYTSDGDRQASMRVNSELRPDLLFPSTGSWETPGLLEVQVKFNEGENTIRFFNENDWAPHFDRIDFNNT